MLRQSERSPLFRLLVGDDTPGSGLAVSGRATVYLFLVVWGWPFIRTPQRLHYVLREPFLHLVNLPFHEFGHLLFSPFGELLTALGGSLCQVLVPLIAVGSFLTTSPNPFGASVALWWAGENLLDIAPYIDDARELQLVLLGGRTGAEVEGHDWECVLGLLGRLHEDHQIATFVHRAGVATMVGALAWGAVVLFHQVRLARTA